MESKDIRRLDPKKKIVKRIFRKYEDINHEKDIDKPSLEEQFTSEVSKIYAKRKKKEKRVASDPKHMIITILILILIISIAVVASLIFMPRKMTAVFIDKSNQEVIEGKVYFDQEYIGNTEGGVINLPKDSCVNMHVVKLKTDTQDYEWTTSPIDCLSQNINFYVKHAESELSNDVEFRFFDSSKTQITSGKIYFDDTFYKDINEKIVISREECRKTNKIKIDREAGSNSWRNNIANCDTSSVIEFNLEEKTDTIVLKFLDSTELNYLSGNLFFDNVLIKYIDGPIIIYRKDCQKINTIRLEETNAENEVKKGHEISFENGILQTSNKWDNNKNFCADNFEIQFKGTN